MIVELVAFWDLLIFPLGLPIVVNLLLSAVILARRHSGFPRLSYYTSALFSAYLASAPLLFLATGWSLNELTIIYPKYGLPTAFAIMLLGLFAPLVFDPHERQTTGAADFNYFWHSCFVSIFLMFVAISIASLQPESPSLQNAICEDDGKQFGETLDANLPDMIHDIETTTGKRVEDLIDCQ